MTVPHFYAPATGRHGDLCAFRPDPRTFAGPRCGQPPDGPAHIDPQDRPAEYVHTATPTLPATQGAAA